MNLTYTERFARLVTEIQRNIRRRKTDEHVRFAYNGVGYDLADRTQRMALIEQVTDDYVMAHAEVNQSRIDAWEASDSSEERPCSIPMDSALIERLANAILDEELTDRHPDKMTIEGYPIMSDRQLSGRHAVEYSEDLGEAYDATGKNRGIPLRRHRIAKEHRFVDKLARAKNRERNAQYKRDSSPGAVASYNLFNTGGELTESFVKCKTIPRLFT